MKHYVIQRLRAYNWCWMPGNNVKFGCVFGCGRWEFWIDSIKLVTYKLNIRLEKGRRVLFQGDRPLPIFCPGDGPKISRQDSLGNIYRKNPITGLDEQFAQVNRTWLSALGLGYREITEEERLTRRAANL